MKSKNGFLYLFFSSIFLLVFIKREETPVSPQNYKDSTVTYQLYLSGEDAYWSGCL